MAIHTNQPPFYESSMHYASLFRSIALAIALVGACMAVSACKGSKKGSRNGGSSGSKPADAFRLLDLTTGKITKADSTYNPASAPTTTMVFVKIPAGNYYVGDVKPIVPAEAARLIPVTAYWIGVYEVTQAQWMALAGGTTPWTLAGPTSMTGPTATIDKAPAFNLSTTDVTIRLTAYSTGSATPSSISLPTEDQWEVACRGGATTLGLYAWGDDDSITTIAKYAHCFDTGAYAGTGVALVGGRQPNGFGLYDTHGNVAELVDPGTNPNSVTRGGGWTSGRTELRASARVVSTPKNQPQATIGVRLILNTTL